MFLKSLTLRGFKSFAEKTVLEFEPGVTVVVGPNGSGKSNLVDAVAWVLGAQGLAPARRPDGRRHLRRHAGAVGTRPVRGVAHDRQHGPPAADRVHGSDDHAHALPRRRVRVPDQRRPCRLLDIQELLSDTGIGRQQHVIVGQGQLDEVLTAQPGDRRAVIEEAAGVLKFRKRRERAERRLEATEGNLLRLNDLVREVGRQLRPLEKQADAARRYGGVEAEMRAIRLYLAGHEIAGRQTRLERLHDARNENAEKERLVRARLRELDRSVLDIEHSLTALGHDDAAEALVRAETMRERARGLRVAGREAARPGARADRRRRRGRDRDAGRRRRRATTRARRGRRRVVCARAEARRGGSGRAGPGRRARRSDRRAGGRDRGRAGGRGGSKPTSAGATPKPKLRRRARLDALDLALGEARPGPVPRRSPTWTASPARSPTTSSSSPVPKRRSPPAWATRSKPSCSKAATRPAAPSTSRPATRALVLVAEAFPTGARRRRCRSASARRVRSSAPASTSPRCSSGSSPASCSWKADGGRARHGARPARCRRRHPRRRPARRFGPVAPRQRDGTGGDPGRAGRRRRRSRRRRDGAPPSTELGPRRSRNSKPSAPRQRDAQAAHDAAVAELDRAATDVAAMRRDLEVRAATLAERWAALTRRLEGVDARLSSRDAHDRARRSRATAPLSGRARLPRGRATLDRFADRGRRHPRPAARGGGGASRRRRGRRASASTPCGRSGRAEQEGAETREKLSRAEIDEAETRMRLENAIEKLRTDFDCEPAVALDAPSPRFPRERRSPAAPAARTRAADARPDQPVGAAGARRLAERHALLQQQLDDVKESRRELLRDPGRRPRDRERVPDRSRT